MYFYCPEIFYIGTVETTITYVRYIYIIYAFVRLISIDATVRMMYSTVVSCHLMAYRGTFSLVTSPTIWWVSVELQRRSVTGLGFLKYI